MQIVKHPNRPEHGNDCFLFTPLPTQYFLYTWFLDGSWNRYLGRTKRSGREDEENREQLEQISSEDEEKWASSRRAGDQMQDLIQCLITCCASRSICLCVKTVFLCHVVCGYGVVFFPQQCNFSLTKVFFVH